MPRRPAKSGKVEKNGEGMITRLSLGSVVLKTRAFGYPNGFQ
jgi:hypothetical protein